MAYGYQTQAMIDQMRQAPAAPAAASPFARGGKVKTKPNFNTGAVAEAGGAAAADIAGRIAGNTAAGAAAGMGISLGTGALADKLKVKEKPITFGENNEFRDLVGGYGRRQEGTGGGAASNAVRYAGYGANPGLVAATGGLSVPVAALAGAIKGWATKNAPTAYSDLRVEDAATAIGDAYKKYLGREASQDEIQGRLVGQGWDPTGGDRWVGQDNLFSQLGFIRDSDEAKAYAARQAAGGAEGGEGATAAGAAPAGTDPFATFMPAASQPQTSAPTGAGAAGALSPATMALAGRIGQGGGITAPTAPGAAQAATAPADGPLGALSKPDSSGRDPFNGGGVVGPRVTGAGIEDTAAPAGGATAPNPAWNTDGYDPPAFAATPASVNPPGGWDKDKWNDPNHQTPKYGVGRILSNFPPTVEGLQAAMPDIERAYPGTTFNGKDKITIPGVGEVDVLEGASKGGVAWRWGANDSGDAAADSGATAASGGGELLSGLGEGGNQADIAAIIASLLQREGQNSPAGLTQSLLAKMRATA